MAKLKDMSQAEVIDWIKTFTYPWKKKIIDGITEYANSMGFEMTGKILVVAELDFLKSQIGLDHGQAFAFLTQIAKKKNESYEQEAPTPNPNNNDGSNEIITFTLKIHNGVKTFNIKGVNQSWTVSKVKLKFLESVGDYSKAELYQNHASAKWVSPGQKDGIELKRDGKNIADGKTLGDLSIYNGVHAPLCTAFRVNGGAAEFKGIEEDEYDKIRPRKLDIKLLKEAGVRLSKKPCCIMGYTDMDGISRAEMPCGCAFAADTMFRYMKSLFEKDLKAVKPICPVPKGACKGSDKQRQWQWGLVFAVSDLSDKEEARYTKAIENRLGSTKNCPNCGAITSMPDDVRISRVNCSACSGSDWCWNCCKSWKKGSKEGGGINYGPICGNDGCMAEQLNTLLSPEHCGTMKTPSGGLWNTTNAGEYIVKTRACPKCLCLLEFVDECKHMQCVSCPHEFCHNCVRDWKKGECSHNIKCTYSGPQKFV